MQSRTLSRILTKSRMFLLYDGSGWLNNFSLFQDFSAWTLNTNSQSTTTIRSKRAHLCDSCENVLFASIVSSRLIFLSTSGPSNLNPLTNSHTSPYPTQLVDPSLLQERQGLLKCVCFQKLSCDHHLFWIFPPKLSSSSCWDCCVFLCYALELQPQIASTHHPQR